MKIRLSKSRSLLQGGFAGVSGAAVAGLVTAGVGAYAASKSSSGAASGSPAAGGAPGASAGGGGGGTVFNAGSIFGTVSNSGRAEGGGGGSASYAQNADPTLGPAANSTPSWLWIVGGVVVAGLLGLLFWKKGK
jgi:hypothetical protein